MRPAGSGEPFKEARSAELGAVRGAVAAELSRRDLLRRAGGVGLGAMVLAALPVVEELAAPDAAGAVAADPDGTLQAFFDTIIPGKPVPDLRTELGNEIHAAAIAGVDAEHGAVYTDALLLAHNPKIGFDALEPTLLAELQTRTTQVAPGSTFLDLDYGQREAVCIAGLDFDNPSRVVWEAGAAVPFTAFCAAANIREAVGRPGTPQSAAGYRVMGHPGTAPHGYDDFSYRLRLNRGVTPGGSLP